MAGLGRVFGRRALQPLFSTSFVSEPVASALRFPHIHTASALLKDDKDKERDDDDDSSKGWFSRFKKISKPEQAHSAALANQEAVYEFQYHSVRPECMDEYLKQFGNFQQLLKEKEAGVELVGSFTVVIGEQDEAVHIWQYSGGYPALSHANSLYRSDPDFVEFRKQRNVMLRSRSNQILMSFSFWPQIQPRPGSNIYELRSYTLRPGTLYEWGNCWAKGIKFRQTNNEPVGGFFTQIGHLYCVEHIWGYKDLQTRKETREAAWGRPGWDECVSNTVALTRHMQSRILIPTPFSPLQ